MSTNVASGVLSVQASLIMSFYDFKLEAWKYFRSVKLSGHLYNGLKEPHL